MKKFTLLAAISMMAFAGCTCGGQGWRPNILGRLHDRVYGVSNVGAPCDATCAPVAHAPIAYGTPDCATCGTGVVSSYGGYEGDYYGSSISEQPYSIGAPPQTYAPTPPENVRPRPAQ